MSDRLTNYEIGVNPDRITQILTQRHDQMLALYTTWANRQATIYTAVQVILVAHSVGVSEWVDYYNFTFRIDRLFRVAGTGVPFTNEATILKNRWIALGLDTLVLKAIIDATPLTP
jgi:hypothetical protein